MSSFLFAAFFAIYGFSAVLAGVDYYSGCEIPCTMYFDGCNQCRRSCFDGELTSACTRMYCFEYADPYCMRCGRNTYYLRYFSFQIGSISCDSRFLKAPYYMEDNSQCACPSSHPYLYTSESLDVNICITEKDCPRRGSNKLPNGISNTDFFEYPSAINYGCEIEYHTCTSDSDCTRIYPNSDVYCDKPLNNYETCVPLYCNLDENCNLLLDDGCSNVSSSDCMGNDWGYCKLQSSYITTTMEPDTDIDPITTDISTTSIFDCKYYCSSFYDGCNACTCDETGDNICTDAMCIWYGTPYCSKCADDNLYWLSNAFDSCGNVLCESKDAMGDCKRVQSSICACPRSHPYLYPGIGCVMEDSCTADSGCSFDTFSIPTVIESGCSYSYETCFNSIDCSGDGFVCEIPVNNYATCVSLFCQLDGECAAVDCLDDCMGTGIGVCTPPTISTFGRWAK